jgi:hypothetical protein
MAKCRSCVHEQNQHGITARDMSVRERGLVIQIGDTILVKFSKRFLSKIWETYCVWRNTKTLGKYDNTDWNRNLEINRDNEIIVRAYRWIYRHSVEFVGRKGKGEKTDFLFNVWPKMSGFGGLASGTQDRGFTIGRSRWIFRAKKSSACLPSEGK